MRLVEDYIEKFEKEQKEIEALLGHPEEMAEKDYKNLELIKQLVNARRSQYKYVENKEYHKLWVNVIYPVMCELAKISGGKVTLEINEESLVGKLTYLGHELSLNNVFSGSLECFRLMLECSDDLFICAKDGLTELQFIFRLYDKEQVEDNSQEIKNLQKQLFTKPYFERMYVNK